MFCIIQKIVFIFAAGNDKSHITMSEINQTINLHVSVDCVLIGFDGEQFRVLLVRQVGKQSEDGYNNMKLPGSLIYDDEDLDEAAKRVLNELTGLKNVKLTQFKAYGSKNRTRNPKDVLWLERFHRLDEKKIDRIVTIAYLTLVKIDRRFEQLSDKYDGGEKPGVRSFPDFAGCIGTYTPLCGICPFRNVRLASPEVYGSPAADCLSVDL